MYWRIYEIPCTGFQTYKSNPARKTMPNHMIMVHQPTSTERQCHPKQKYLKFTTYHKYSTPANINFGHHHLPPHSTFHLICVDIKECNFKNKLTNFPELTIKNAQKHLCIYVATIEGHLENQQQKHQI